VREVSEYMGFESEQAVFKWQRGDSMPTLDNMLALSRLFNTPIDDILCERDDEEGR
jgi:transcriptional regulator with XRE-family HTH domain